MWAVRFFIVFTCVSIHCSVCRMPAIFCFILTALLLSSVFCVWFRSCFGACVDAFFLSLMHTPFPESAQGFGSRKPQTFNNFTFFITFVTSPVLFPESNHDPRTVGMLHLCSWQLTMATVKWCACSWTPEPGVRPSPCERRRRMGMRKWWGWCWKQVGQKVPYLRWGPYYLLSSNMSIWEIHYRWKFFLWQNHLSIWVNYNHCDLIVTSLESWWVRGIIPKWPNFSG